MPSIYGRLWADDKHLEAIRLSIRLKAMRLDELTQWVSVRRSPGSKPWKAPVFRSWRVCGPQWHRLRIGSQRENLEESKRCGILKAHWEKCFRQERIISCVRCCWWLKWSKDGALTSKFSNIGWSYVKRWLCQSRFPDSGNVTKKCWETAAATNNESQGG